MGFVFTVTTLACPGGISSTRPACTKPSIFIAPSVMRSLHPQCEFELHARRDVLLLSKACGRFDHVARVLDRRAICDARLAWAWRRIRMDVHDVMTLVHPDDVHRKR